MPIPDQNQYAICLRLIRELNQKGCWCGTTHIQQIAYVMQALFADKPVWEFVLYKHGPRSFALDAVLESLLQTGHIRYGVLYPLTRRAQITKEGEKFSKIFAHLSGQYADAIEKTADMLSAHSIQALDNFSTVVFYNSIYRRKSDTPILAQKLRDTKPFLSLPDAESIVFECRTILSNLTGVVRGDSNARMQVCLA